MDKRIRYHLLKTLHRPIHFGSGGNIVLDLVHEGRMGDAPRIRGCISAARSSRFSLRVEKELLTILRTFVPCLTCPPNLEVGNHSMSQLLIVAVLTTWHTLPNPHSAVETARMR